MKPNTLSGRKAFPKTTAWFLYEVQRHPRWACSLGSLLNLTLNMPNKPTPLEISFEKLSLLVFFLSFFFVSFSRGCPRCNIADVNQREKRCGEKVERIRQSWPLFTREDCLCEQGEGSSLGYETADLVLTRKVDICHKTGIFGWLRVELTWYWAPLSYSFSWRWRPFEIICEYMEKRLRMVTLSVKCNIFNFKSTCTLCPT